MAAELFRDRLNPRRRFQSPFDADKYTLDSPEDSKTSEKSEDSKTSEESEDDVDLDELSQVLADFISSGDNATFTCGGAIPIEDVAVTPSSGISSSLPTPSRAAVATRSGASAPASATSLTSGPIVIRWDRGDGTVAKVHLPVEGTNSQALEDLVGDCQPAGFGHHGKDAYDEGVRKAWAMDSSQFSTNLCPYSLGIADRLTQILLPNATSVVELGGRNGGGFIKVEPYKLNVYKGPSGFFKPHVDTPRGAAHFGSLVICLPSSHVGGQLTVRHRHPEDAVSYEWDGPQGAEMLQWAAFYNDCEHEVREVTAGYRVTLTYNLYYVPRVDDAVYGLRSKPAPVDIARLAPYAKMQTLLENPEWMENGGVLGIYCSHAYATTTSKVVNLDGDESRRSPSPEPLPSDSITMLKGTDMSLFAVFVELGLEVRVKSILNDMEALAAEKGNEKNYPVVSSHAPGAVGKTYLVGDWDENPKEILTCYGNRLRGVYWVTQPLWRNLGLIHGNVSASSLTLAIGTQSGDPTGSHQ